MTKTRGFLLTAGIVLAMAFTLSCSGDDKPTVRQAHLVLQMTI